ncbi:MAG: ABC transporter permease [Verrucomicrobia bacterium]|nr:ABC transporter permease [Verrucomicrobiota bacterium]
MLDDLKFAFRVLFKYPVHSLVVVLTLAIGIGATTTVYSFAKHLWTPAPDFREIHRLLAIYGTGAGREGGSTQSPGGISPADFRDWQMEVGGFEPLAAWTGWLADLSGEAAPERLCACLVTANFFATLGVRPAWGTFFSNGADEPGAEPEVMLSHGLWQRRFGGDTNIVGRSIQLTGTGYRVVGVLPERARYPQGAELWVPLKLGVEEWAERDRAYLRVLGRLKPGVTAGQAAAELRTVSERLAREYRQPGGIRALQVRSVREELMFGQLAAAGFAGGVAMFVLLLVCANVASLQLALGLARRQEFAVRAALGADCRRLVRQLLTESCLLALVGGGLGMLFAVWGIPLARARLAAEQLASVAGLDAVRLSLSGLGFTVGISLLAGMLTGLMPALATATADVMSTLISEVRRRMQGLDAQLPLLGLEPLEKSVRRGLGVVPLLAPLLGGLGVLALGLCAVGIYGVMAYNVWAREPEIGIRLALGATRPAVFRLIMGGGLGLAAWGLGIGFPVAVGLSWVLVNQAFELAAGVRFQFLVLGGVLLAIAIISLAACWLPARRAMRIDPMTALRRE